MELKNSTRVLQGAHLKLGPRDIGDDIAFADHKIAFLLQYCKERDVLDIGCVAHDPEAYRSRYWVHKAVAAVAKSIVGMDLHEEGVSVLRARGFNVVAGDAENFDLGRTFDVVVAGDLIEHRGRLLVSTPNPWYWRNIIKAALHTEVNNNPEHVCWLCPRALRQLVARHDMDLGEIQFGSRYMRDRLMPLPRGWKHTSYHAVILPKN